MAGVVIIHAQEDSAPAHALATKLRVLGHETATDLTPRLMRGAMSSAEVAVALWSPRSTANADLVAEARHARASGKLIHARMHNTPAPDVFRGDPSVDLTGWRGDDAFAGWLNLKAAIEGVLLAAQENESAARDAENAAAFDAFGDYEPARNLEAPPPARHTPPPQPRPAPAPTAAEAGVYEEPEIEPDDPAREESARDWAALERAARVDESERRAPRARTYADDLDEDERPRFSAYGEGRSGYETRPRRSDRDYERRDGEERPRGGSPMRLAIIGVVTFLVVAGVGIGGYSMIQSGRTSAAAAEAWAALDKTDPLALRAFLDGEPGRYRQPAEAALEGLEIDHLGRARETDTIQAYQSFLASFPETRHSAEISGRMAMLRQRERDLGLAPELAEEEKTPEQAGLLETAPDPEAPVSTATPVAPEPELPGGPVLLTPQTDDPPPAAEDVGRSAATEAQQRATEQELRMQIMQGN